MSDDTREGDAIKQLYSLWTADNAVANQKLAMYFVIQGILVNALNALSETPLAVPLLGIIVSAVWLFSMARTQAYRNHWNASISKLTKEEPYKHLALLPPKRDKAIPWYGKVPSGVVLIGSPVMGLFLWVAYLYSHLRQCT